MPLDSQSTGETESGDSSAQTGGQPRRQLSPKAIGGILIGIIVALGGGSGIAALEGMFDKPKSDEAPVAARTEDPRTQTLASATPEPLDISLTCTIDPQTPKPGQIVRLTYQITSNRSLKVGLGSDLRRDTDESGEEDETSYATGLGDVSSVSVQVGENLRKSRPVKIPTELPPGDYELQGEIWPEDRIGETGLETLADIGCANFAVH